MSQTPLEPGMRVGRYTVVGVLGRGGMGGVVEVEDTGGRRFALKSPVMDVGGHAEVTRRFAREANAMRVLDHPNVVAAVDVFVEGGQLYLVMEKVAGRPLSAAIAEGPIEPHRALALGRQILAGAGHAHGHGVVHRDLKPDNVLLVPMPSARGEATGWERAVVIDFGIVKLMGDAAAAFGAGALTSTGHVFGTPQYMAPEQALGRIVDPRADLYAIGVMLYEMLAGAPPFRDPDPMALMYLHAKVAPKPLRTAVHDAAWCTPEVVALVEGALAKAPEHRFPSAQVMTAVLEDAFASIAR